MIRRILTKVPSWGLTAAVTAAILYLTLVPRPLPDNDLMLIQGMDKIAHAMMFGILTLVMALDYARRFNGFTAIAPRKLMIFASISTVFGGSIEIAQLSMGLGRGGDIADLLADMAGILIFTFIANPFIRFASRH